MVQCIPEPKNKFIKPTLTVNNKHTRMEINNYNIGTVFGII
jgi:hypothetical protein